MRLPEFFQFKKKEARPLVKDFDQALIRKISKNRFPSWSQIKYLFHFLNKKEKVTFWTSFSLIIITTIIWAIFFIFEHLAILPMVGGEYIEGLVGSPKLINPIYESANDTDADISRLLYAKLFTYDENRKLIPSLVKEYELSEDKKTYTFTLKDDIYWSTGEKIITDDVAFTIDVIQNPETGSPLFNSFQGVVVEKIDEKKFSLTLKEPFSPFLNNLVLGIIPEKIFGQINPINIKLAKDNLQPTMVSGPYVFVKMIKDNSTNKVQTYTLKRNEKYHDTKPYLENIVFKFYDSYEQAITDLRNQSIHGLGFIPNSLKEKVVSKNINLYDLQLPQYIALFFNQIKEKVLKDDVLRNCLALSIDKKVILEEALKNNGQIVHSPFLKNEMGYYSDIKKTSYNPEEANSLLDKSWSRVEPTKFEEIRKEQIMKKMKENYVINTATTTESTENSTTSPNFITLVELEELVNQEFAKEIDSTQSFYRKDKNNNILSLTITTVDIPEFRKVAEIVARFWKNIGIQVFIEPIDGKKITKENIRERNYSVLLFGEMLGGDPDPYAFWHSSQTQFPGLNLALFSDKDADKLIEDARITDDIAKREENYKKFQDILVKKNPAIFLYTPSYTYAIDTNVKGVSIKSILTPDNRFNTLGRWYLKTAKQWK